MSVGWLKSTLAGTTDVITAQTQVIDVPTEGKRLVKFRSAMPSLVHDEVYELRQDGGVCGKVLLTYQWAGESGTYGELEWNGEL